MKLFLLLATSILSQSDMGRYLQPSGIQKASVEKRDAQGEWIASYSAKTTFLNKFEQVLTETKFLFFSNLFLPPGEDPFAGPFREVIDLFIKVCFRQSITSVKKGHFLIWFFIHELGFRGQCSEPLARFQQLVDESKIFRI